MEDDIKYENFIETIKEKINKYEFTDYEAINIFYQYICNSFKESIVEIQAIVNNDDLATGKKLLKELEDETYLSSVTSDIKRLKMLIGTKEILKY